MVQAEVVVVADVGVEAVAANVVVVADMVVEAADVMVAEAAVAVVDVYAAVSSTSPIFAFVMDKIRRIHQSD